MAYPEMLPLVRLVGPDVALEILLEGRIFDAQEAKEKRLVTRVVPDADVAAEALATAQRVADGAPLVARWHKRFARRLADSRPITADEYDECFDCFDSEDFRIGYAAFSRSASRRSPADEMTDTARPPATEPHPGPLAGMRVLELAQIMAGPTCGMMLADMGADVVKVEKLPGGDDARSYSEPRVGGVSAPFLMLNRNKRGIALDLKKPQGRSILLRMVRDADVVTENFRRGTLEKLGLGYDVLARENPGLIYCAISGYGRDGPDADKGGFDLIAQGLSGLMSITGERGGPPVKTGNPVADINAGILAFGGIVAAYVHKLKTGNGQIVDTSLLEAGLQQTYWHAAAFFATGVSPQPTGSAHLLTAPYQAFRARDGWLNIGGANQANWARIADVLGHPEWRDDPRFASNSARMENLDALVAAMTAGLSTRTASEWIAAFDAGRRAGRPCQHDRRGAHASPDARARHGRRSRPPRGLGRRRPLAAPCTSRRRRRV
jgi:crotonobetainyl-CoA:carnitine CoA-transferase CaiB-like acyl-CoA transferase